MLRRKNLESKVKKDDFGKSRIAEFFSLKDSDVVSGEVKTTFEINIDGNEKAQELFKQLFPYGNTGDRPGTYDFSKNILVGWDGNRVILV